MTETDSERSLADIPLVDSTPQVTPEGFDVSGFLAGVRPTRRSVKIFPNAALVARLDEIVEEIEATPEHEDVDALIDEFEACKKEFHDSGVWFTIEQRSNDWVDKFRADICKKLGLKITKDDDDDTSNSEDRADMILHQVAAQIVAPSGVTFEDLKRLAEANEGEAGKLIYCMTQVNTMLAESAQVLTRDFSQRRSAKPPRRGSSRR